ncbi:E3 ubiquitin-protein ligase Mdm2-like isoform X2 [Sitophilus oryzae]|uniref:E3 ubiquitin-protein ligase Mdm2-like isoform X2 n=1 Tax=Sitophilus oryzae TaxID=7048 RepID=A0A6J2XK47_SITOR|nr:E3 ubiquitin-protein ligase Mdm2-like isoform X2 [Sitophilus oryzae]
MSTTVERSSDSPWRKRPRDDDLELDIKELKRPRSYYFRLASESSKASEDDTESIYSLQDKETDVVRDTSDTETQDDSDLDKYELEFEYEVASLSDDAETYHFSSSDPEDMVLAAAVSVICDSDLEVWVTDVEDSDSSSDETSLGRTDFTSCVQCRGENDNPLFRYCEKCFQDRKKFFPPRPKRTRRRKANAKTSLGTTTRDSQEAIKLSTLQNCLSGLSQDSGVGSSQECPPLNFDRICVPEDVRSSKGNSKNEDISPSTSQSLTELEQYESDTSKDPKPSSGKETSSNFGRKRLRSESTSDDSGTESSKKPKTARDLGYTSSSTPSIGEKSSLSAFPVDKSSFSSESSGFSSGASQERASGSEFDRSEAELCMFCNSAPKDSIFLHTNIAHRCCCYDCAKKTMKSIKRCPICNRSVNKVVKIFTS